MFKLRTLTFAGIILLAGSFISVSAEDDVYYDGQGIRYWLYNDGTCSVADNSDYKGSPEVVIPPMITIDGKEFYQVMDPGYFEGNEVIRKVTYTTDPLFGFQGVIQQENHCIFRDCPNLTEVNFSGCPRVYSINGICENCPSLTTINASGTSISGISGMTFRELPSLEVLDLSGCNHLDLVIDGTFYRNESLRRVDLRGCTALESIGPYAFEDCPNLREVLLDGCLSLKTIGYSAFAGCSSLESVGDLGGCINIETIGEGAFAGCSSLESVGDLGNLTKLTIIEASTFSGCSSLTSVGDLRKTNITAIWAGAFVDTGLTVVDFSGWKTLKKLSGAFKDCKKLISVNLSGCVNLEFIDGSIFGTFENCENLRTVDLSGNTSIELIPWLNFKNCRNLETVNLSGCTAISYIGQSAFEGCEHLRDLDLSEFTNLQSIKHFAFKDCRYNLTRVDLPETLTEIGCQAFSGCKYLKTVYCHTPTPPEFQEIKTGFYTNYLFSAPMTTEGTLWVPEESAQAYRDDPYWGKAFQINPEATVSTDFDFDFSDITEDMDGVEISDDNTISISLGSSYTFRLVAKDGGELPELFWSSSNPDVATVDQNGTVTAVSAGQATIKATVVTSRSRADGATELSCDINVIDTSSIETIFNDGGLSPVEVFDLNGRFIGSYVNNGDGNSISLQPGLYIIRQGSKSKKVLLK